MTMTYPARYRLRSNDSNLVVEFTSLCEGKVIEASCSYNKGWCSDIWFPCDDETKWERLSDPLPTFHSHPDHSRFLKVVFIEDGVEKTMNLEVRYIGESNADNGCMLDGIVMPAIKEKLDVRD